MKLIWKESSQLPKLTEAMIKAAEEQLQVRLPKAYLDILARQNGGYIEHTAFPTTEQNSWAEDHVYLDNIYGIAENDGILQSAYLIKEWDLPSKIVLFGGDGHSWFAFDYRATDENPPVIYLEAGGEIELELATDFEAFVGGLYTHRERDLDGGSPGFSVNDAIHIFETEQKELMVQAFNIFYNLRAGNEPLIEHWIITLLQHGDLDIRKWAGHYAYVFHELNLWTPEQIHNILTILKQDEALQPELQLFLTK